MSGTDGPHRPVPERSGTPELSIVLPAHNEVALLGSTVTNIVAGIESRAKSFEIIVVENGSSDGTLRLARLLAAQLPQVRVLTLPRGNYGAALASGFQAARGDRVVNFDVDYYDLVFLDKALAVMDRDADAIVVASKRAKGSSDGRPLPRRLLTFAFTLLLRSVLGLPVSDAHGMKVLERSVLAPIVDRCALRGSIFDVELVLRAARAGLGVGELPAVVVERRATRSSVSRRTLEALVSIVRLRILLGAPLKTPGAADQPEEADARRPTQAIER